jgi:predicted RNase H-like HicB family nuclease
MDLTFDGHGDYARAGPLAKGGQREKPSQRPEFAIHLQSTFTISNLDALVSRHYNSERGSMERITIESIPIVVGMEEDGRWWADIESMPGVMAYGVSRDMAISAVRALALRVAADCIEHGEEIPEPFTKVLSVARDGGPIVLGDSHPACVS